MLAQAAPHFSVATRKRPLMEMPAPPPMQIPSRKAMCGRASLEMACTTPVAAKAESLRKQRIRQQQGSGSKRWASVTGDCTACTRTDCGVGVTATIPLLAAHPHLVALPLHSAHRTLCGRSPWRHAAARPVPTGPRPSHRHRHRTPACRKAELGLPHTPPQTFHQSVMGLQ